MRVGVNLLWLVPDDVGGTEDYAVRLLAGIAERAPADIDIALFALPAFRAAHPDLVARFPTAYAPVAGGHRMARVAVESSWLAAQARRRKLDLVHHLGGTVPLLRGAPAMVTIHDLQPLLRPETFRPVKRRYLQAMLPWSVRSARRVEAVSRFTADGIIERLHVPPDRLDVVPHGIDPDLVRPTDAAIEAVRGRYGVGERWFTFPSVTYPYKNHALLVRAFATVAAADPDVSLVLTGRPDTAEPDLLAEITRLGLGDRVCRTERIRRADVDALIAGAVAVLLPSTFEGFGAPALEAMALATPVVAARAASLPEVVADAGLIANPHDADDWSRAMALLLNDEAERTRLIEAGLVRARDYGWDAAADVQIEAWRRAVTQP
jgi:alpha-1,3-rhamnosyl/mannosyltransferase